MPIDIPRALDAMQTFSGPVAQVEGVAAHELARSVAAARVGAAAARDGLLLYHFEHRTTLPLPAAWVAEGGDPSLPEWVDGVLPEPKYASFRHDLPIGSHHPGHRAKWAAHELCHALVGFAWRPGATPLFHATAGRLAELVPVVLWYFLDEVGLRRCPRHDGPLFRTFCPACEAAAAQGPTALRPERAERLLRHAEDFVRGELDALARTRSRGEPCPHVWGSLDLCSDGVAYAVAHGPRLDSPGFAAFAERYLVEGEGGWHRDLDALVDRSLAVLRHLAEGTPLAPLGGDRSTWVRQDLAARLLQAADGDPAAVAPLWDALDADDPEALVATYADWADAHGAPHPGDTFGLGYAWAGAGRAVDQIDEGLRTVVPTVMELADDAEVDLAEAFVAADRPRRVPLGLRFADWLDGQGAEVLGGLARYEAMLRAARGAGAEGRLGPGQGWRWAEGAMHWRGGFDPVAFGEEVAAGAVEAWHDPEAPVGVAFAAPPRATTALAIGRDPAGDLVLAALPTDGGPVDADPAQLEALAELGLVVPERFPL